MFATVAVASVRASPSMATAVDVSVAALGRVCEEDAAIYFSEKLSSMVILTGTGTPIRVPGEKSHPDAALMA